MKCANTDLGTPIVVAEFEDLPLDEAFEMAFLARLKCLISAVSEGLADELDSSNLYHS